MPLPMGTRIQRTRLDEKIARTRAEDRAWHALCRKVLKFERDGRKWAA